MKMKLCIVVILVTTFVLAEAKRHDEKKHHAKHKHVDVGKAVSVPDQQPLPVKHKVTDLAVHVDHLPLHKKIKVHDKNRKPGCSKPPCEKRKLWRHRSRIEKTIRKHLYELGKRARAQLHAGAHKDKKDHKHHVKTGKEKEYTDKIKRMKVKANAFALKYNATKKHHHKGGKKHVHHMQKNKHSGSQVAAECTPKKLAGMGDRLLKWFRQLQDMDTMKHFHVKHMHKHLKHKRSVQGHHKNEECRCQRPVSWQFTQMDTNKDNKLSLSEMSDLENNEYENCAKPFFHRCDLNSDNTITHSEWCCCFSEIMPPCLAAQNNVPATLLKGEPQILPGSFVPKCDGEGFYKKVQCHASIGYCWCADRNGHALEGTRVRGQPKCDARLYRRHYKNKLRG